ncbi:MAG: proton-conducting transporter membrane subunit [Sphaerochaetaceae bacterium]|nr:proton-conducting transporter membrane subunit [Sphaerochaetaceae bacterium]
MNPDSLLLTPIFLPLLAASIVLTSKSFLPVKARRFSEYFGILIGLLMPIIFVLLLYPYVINQGSLFLVIGSYTPKIGIVYKFDSLSLVMIVLTNLLTLPAWIYSRTVGPSQSYFTALILIQSATIAAISMTNDIFNLFVCLEVMGLIAYVLISSKQEKNAVFAAFNYMMYSSSSMVFFLLGSFGLYRLTGSLSYQEITNALLNLSSKELNIALICLLLMIVPILLRVAIMPLSNWLVGAHSKAPHAVSALLSGILIKIPLFVLVRVFSISPILKNLTFPLAYIGSATALIGVIFALSQSDAKKLLAYHSISQIGYIITAWAMALNVGIDTTPGAILLIAALFHTFSHAIFKGLLFLSIGTATDAAESRDVYKIRGVNSILSQKGERFPITMICFLVGALSIMAIPPFNGFFSKTLLTYYLKPSINYTILSIAGVGTVASFIKLSRIFLPNKQIKEQTKEFSKEKFPFSIHLSLIILALLALLTGIFSQNIFELLENMFISTSKRPINKTIFFSQANIIKTLYTVLGGVLLFVIATSKVGSKVLHKLKGIKTDFTDQYFHFAITITLLSYFLFV